MSRPWRQRARHAPGREAISSARPGSPRTAASRPGRSDVRFDIACRYDPAWGSCANFSLRAPVGAKVQGNDATNASTDRHLTVIDQSDASYGKEFDMWQVGESPLPGTSGTLWTGFSGWTYALTGDGRTVAGNANAGHFGNLAGRVRVEELSAALQGQTYINHALTIVVPCTDGFSVYPAGGGTGLACPAGQTTDAPSMGARFHLRMSLADIDALPVPEWKKVFLRTLSVYGAFVNDTGTDDYFNWQLESGNQYTSMGVSDKWLEFGAARKAENGSDWYDDGAGGYKGLWMNGDDTINWTQRVWSNLEVVQTPQAP